MDIIVKVKLLKLSSYEIILYYLGTNKTILQRKQFREILKDLVLRFARINEQVVFFTEIWKLHRTDITRLE